MKARDDQLIVETELRSNIARNQAVLVQCPTGWGKTFLATTVASGAYHKGKRVIFAVHRKQLITQTARTFDSFELPYSFIASGLPCDIDAQLKIASINTLINRLDEHNTDTLVIDEAHLAASPTWSEVIKHYRKSGAKIILLSATPCRLDGRPLSDVADIMVKGPTTSWCIEAGILSKYRVFAPMLPNLHKAGLEGGEYSTSTLDEIYSKPKIIGDAIDSWKEFAPGKRTIVFCHSRERAAELKEAAISAGIGAVYIDGNTRDRATPIAEFANGEAQWLINIGICTEGFDLSAQIGRDVPIEAGIFMRPTNSLALSRQMIGRVLRRKPDPAIIIDMAGLIYQHGLPDYEPEWSLEGNYKSKGFKQSIQPTCICQNCFSVFIPRFACPYCGEVREIKGRKILEKEGLLTEVDILALREAQAKRDEEKNKSKRRQQVGMCKTVEELCALAVDRNYPPGWVYKTAKFKHIPVRIEHVMKIMARLKA